MLVAVGVLAADIAIRRKRLDTITAVYFGTIIGLFLTYVFRIALTPLLAGAEQRLVELAAARAGHDRVLHAASACCCRPRTTSASSFPTSSSPRK